MKLASKPLLHKQPFSQFLPVVVAVVVVNVVVVIIVVVVVVVVIIVVVVVIFLSFCQKSASANEF